MPSSTRPSIGPASEALDNHDLQAAATVQGEGVIRVPFGTGARDLGKVGTARIGVEASAPVVAAGEGLERRRNDVLRRLVSREQRLAFLGGGQLLQLGFGQRAAGIRRRRMVCLELARKRRVAVAAGSAHRPSEEVVRLEEAGAGTLP